MRALAFALLLAGTLAGAAELPMMVNSAHPGLKPLGDGHLRVLLFDVYDATLYVSGDKWSQDQLFALDLRYLRTLNGKDIAERSITEMKGQGFNDPAVLKRWGEEMARIFPDIKAGDRIVGVSIPGGGARFYNDQKLLGSVSDPEFSKAFFAIWLSERTSEPSLRRKLLKLPE
jgi:Chalcone isomerase-like